MTKLKKVKDRGPFMWGMKGRKIYLTDPQPEDFDIEEIAISLGRECRYGNMCKFFYSVAQHSSLVSSLCPKELQLAGLLDDSSEAYLGDCITQIKHETNIRGNYIEIENKFMEAISIKFGFEYNKKTRKKIKEIEKKVLNTELRDLMDLPTKDFNKLNLKNCLNFQLDKKHCLTSQQATKLFLEKFYEITN